MNLLAIFATGLLTGGLSCLAVQGGLLAATLAQREEERLQAKAVGGQAIPILAFLGAKLLAYTILGLLLGLLGSFFQLSLTARAILQILVALFMLGTAANLLNIHPIFRYFAIQPPRILTRFIHNRSKSGDIFAPALVGALTVFIPCGTTQAMMALAIASGNSLSGALIMFAFVLGTSPVFFILGYLATRLGESLHASFMKLAATAIIIMAFFNLNNASALVFGFTFKDVAREVWCTATWCTEGTQATGEAVAAATVNIGPGGYSPKTITVKAGSSVTLQLINRGGGGCAAAFTIPKLGIQKVVAVGTTETIAFTAPATAGQIPFMCSMGMYRGVINVI